MARKPKPTTVTVGGVKRDVLDRATKYWVERDPGGRVIIHAGRLLESQEPGTLLDEAKPCTVCKGATVTATARGRAVHPTCEGWLDVIPDAIHARIVSGVAADLGATVISSTGPSIPAPARHKERHAA